MLAAVCRSTSNRSPSKNTAHGSMMPLQTLSSILSEFDEKGDYAKGCKELQEAVIISLNSEEHKPITELNLSLREDDQPLF